MSTEALSFEVLDDQRTLACRFQPDPDWKALDRSQLRSLIAEHGYGSWFVLDAGLIELERQQKSATEPVSVPVAEKRDAEIVVHVSPNQMEAQLTVNKAHGGDGPTIDRIKEALAAAGVVHGIDETVIFKACDNGELPKTPVAKGTPPENGENTRFEALVEEGAKKAKPKEREDGTVDYFDLGLVTTIQPGEPVMRRHLPTPGVPGTSVTGQDVPPSPGKDIPWGKIDDSVEFSPDDPNLLLCKVAGQPKLYSNYVKVEPVVKLAKVDLSTGSIHFDGTVIVSGNVESGMEIVAGGDISIAGISEAALLEAKGNIEVRNGVVGHSPDKHTIKAGGSLTTKFIQNSTVEAGSHVYVGEEISQSNVTALKGIQISDHAEHGRISGGHIRAGEFIRCKAIGSPSSVITRVDVGNDPFLKRELRQVEDDLHLRTKKLEEVTKALIHLRISGGQNPLMGQLERAREQLLVETSDLRARQQELQAKIVPVENCKLIATERFYVGVRMRIGEHQKNINTDTPGCTYRWTEKEIVAGPIDL